MIAGLASHLVFCAWHAGPEARQRHPARRGHLGSRGRGCPKRLPGPGCCGRGHHCRRHGGGKNAAQQGGSPQVSALALMAQLI
eukprot:scaffold94421_cov16-Tisochrysis_lutea.AAC.1